MGTVSGKNLTLSVENKFDQRIKSQRKLEGRVVRKEELSYMQVILAKQLRMIEGESLRLEGIISTNLCFT